VFERSVCHFGNGFVRSGPISLYHNGLVPELGRIEQGSKLLDRDSLILKINRRHCASGDADDLSTRLRTERKARERHGYRNALLQDEVRTQQQKKNEQESNVHQCDKHYPSKIWVRRAGELHETAELTQQIKSVLPSELLLQVVEN